MSTTGSSSGMVYTLSHSQLKELGLMSVVLRSPGKNNTISARNASVLVADIQAKILCS